MVGCTPLFSQYADSVSSARGYFLQSYQYYQPMLADIRSPQFHMGVYWDEPVRFSNSTLSGKHAFWDVAFGGFFSLFGFTFEDRPVAHIIDRTGIDFFIDASAHTLLDFNTLSSDVINTDFRFGAGVTSRLPDGFKHFSLRLRAFHESTHIGDEYALAATRNASFRRYNVSYEAVDLYGAFDRYSPKCRVFFPDYFRFYAGARVLTGKANFEDFSTLPEARALTTSDRFEFQFGAEAFFFGCMPPSDVERKKESWIARLLLPQFFVLAGDYYCRDKYAVTDPEKVRSVNIVFGVMYGDYFQGKRTTRWTINYYDGVNPHGQFRTDKISYWGLDFGVGF